MTELYEAALKEGRETVEQIDGTYLGSARHLFAEWRADTDSGFHDDQGVVMLRDKGAR